MDSVILAGISTAAAAIAGLLTIWNFFQSPSKKNATDIADLGTAMTVKIEKLKSDVAADSRVLDDKVDGLSSKVSTLETLMHQMPDKDSLHALEIGLTRITGQLNTMNERLNPIDNLSRRLQEVLLDKTK